jgi:hypothetical protein
MGARESSVSELAEGEGFEPPVPLARDNGFQDRLLKPLGHPSGFPIKKVYLTKPVRIVKHVFMLFQPRGEDPYQEVGGRR